jgi:hypothetical protein
VATLQGDGLQEECRTFSTFTCELLALSSWLKQYEVTHVAMESTGVYWKPVFNILEKDFSILLVNAQHIKNVPGHKTDRKDSGWIAKLLLSGLLKGSFIPPGPIRKLRELYRYKRKLLQQGTSERNRLQKVLEDANIKIGSVLTDVFGVSGRLIIHSLIEGQNDPCILAECARGSLVRSKQPVNPLFVNCKPLRIFTKTKSMRANIEQREAMLSLIEQWQQSGISQKAFYKQHNIPAHVFYYWLKCYKKQQAGLDQSVTPNSFVQLQPSPAPFAGNIELQLTNGNRIFFHQPVSADYLKALII